MFDDPHELLAAFQELYDRCVPTDAQPDLIIWEGPIEDVPQEWMDAAIEDLEP